MENFLFMQVKSIKEMEVVKEKTSGLQIRKHHGNSVQHQLQVVK